MIPYTITQNSITTIIGGLPKTFEKSHVHFEEILGAIQLGDESLVISLSDIPAAVAKYGAGKITVSNGVLYHNGGELHNYTADKLLQFMEESLPVEPLARFLENLMENPSYRAVQELYRFMEVGKMPLTEDGCFLSYKKVRSDFTDIYTGTFDNSVGKVCKMSRNEVNEDSSQTCSSGLHACSYEYLNRFGNGSTDKVVVVKVNPRDVVSIPDDYNFTKMRVCEYKVVQDVTEAYKEANILAESILYKCSYHDDFSFDTDEEY